MIIDKAIKAAIAVASVAAAAGVTVVAASFALYALLETSVGRAGAAAIVAVIFALIALIVAMVSVGRARAAKQRKGGHDQSPAERVFDMVRDRPWIAAVAAIGAGLIAWRKPALMGLLMGAFLGRQPK